MNRLSLALFCFSAFVLSAALSFRVTAAVERPEYAWLTGFDAHGKLINLSSLRGQVVALTFVAKDTREEGSDINEDLSKQAEAGKMTVVSVVDLEGVPRFAHNTALKKIAESDRVGLMHLVDDQGRLKEAFKVDPTRRVTILVLDQEGALRGRFEGEGGLPNAVKLVEQLKR
jgi:hypothetical protein